MDELYARVSKAGQILCGRVDAEGRHTCDQPVAAFGTIPGPVGAPRRCLVALPGWTLDERKGVWHMTTQLEDRRAHGRPQAHVGRYPALPALARCPKCRAVQWLDAGRLQLAPGPNDEGGTFFIPADAPESRRRVHR